MEFARKGCGFKSLFSMLAATICLAGCITMAFLGSASAQNNNTVHKKQTKQSPAKTGRVITVGDHGQLKGFDGLQMALNMAQDMDEIRIEKGVIKGSGLIVAENKVWDNGIKISGGWDESFNIKSDNPEDTAIDGAEEVTGVNIQPRIFTTSKKKMFFENISFKNSLGGAIEGSATFTKCMFANNSTKELYSSGGAVFGNGTFNDCTFINNSTRDNGGAVFGNGVFYNCTFINNSAIGYGQNSGGAVFGKSTFQNCIFIGNRANSGGAVQAGNSSFYNCIFANNSAEKDGGAVDCSSDYNIHISTFSNCVFTENRANSNGGAVNGYATFSNGTFYGNTAKNGTGGAFQGGGRILNSIFYKNIAKNKENDIMVDGDLNIDFSLFNYLVGGADIGMNILMGNPQFIAPDLGDLHLRSDSPCVNKGKQLSGLKGTANMNAKPEIVGKEINMGANDSVLTSALENYKRTRSAASDFAKFKKRAVSAQDKQRFAISFMDAYGKDYNSNSYMLELAVFLPKGYLSDSEYAEANKIKESKYATDVLPFVVVDNKTGLMWVKDGKSAGCNNGEYLGWEEAVEFCDSLISYASYSDWRLPNAKEFASIFDDTENYFVNLYHDPFGSYWADSMDRSEREVHFNTKESHGHSGMGSGGLYHYVCCVRTVTPISEEHSAIPEVEKLQTQKSENGLLQKEEAVVPQVVATTEEKRVKEVPPAELVQ